MEAYVAAIDQGTTSTRCLIFDHSGRIVAGDAREHRQIFPHAGWVEHDPLEIWANTRAVTAGALEAGGLTASDIAAVGITNQRETTVVWDRHTGEPVYNAIVWQDTRTADIVQALACRTGEEVYRARTGLPLATYFAGPKVRWILDNVAGARARAEAGDLCFGTMDTWVLWNATGGAAGGLHVTDPTNASRTLLMDLDTLSWDGELADDVGIPGTMRPEIRSSSERYGTISGDGALAGLPITGILGDQQAATFGQACLSPGEAKNTYGTGNFVLLNTGTERVASEHGLLTTVCYQLGAKPAVYALEGSIAVTGSLVQWVRDNLGAISEAAQIEDLAREVDDNGDCYFVPAFSGLYAPHWRADARGVITGLTRYVTRGHLARAVLEATAFQSREVIDAMNADSGITMDWLKVDGGMTPNELLMQFQADILGVPVSRPAVIETTALGAAYAAGLTVGFWDGEDDIRANWHVNATWYPRMGEQTRSSYMHSWRKAVERSYGWVEGSGYGGQVG
jgi:glycerol kinase